MNKTLVTLIIVVVAVAIAWFLLQRTQEVPAIDADAAHIINDTHSNNHTGSSTTASHNHHEHDHQQGIQNSSNSAFDTMYQADLLDEQLQDVWQLDNNQGYITSTRDPRITGHAIALNLKELAQLQLGDTIALPIPEFDQPLLGVIDNVVSHESGNRSFHGVIPTGPNEINLSAFITVGKKSAHITVETPEGIYMIETDRDGDGSEGIVYPETEITKHIDYSKPDYIVPNYKEDEIEKS